MPPKPSPTTITTTTNKPYFFYGHRKPSQNRPTVQGGLFSNRKTLNHHPDNRNPDSQNPNFTPPFEFHKWDPDSLQPVSPTKTPSEKYFSIAQSLSPVARYICDSFRKHKRWGPSIIADLDKLRRVTPKLVTEVLKVQTDPRISSKFFHWAGKQKGFRHDFASYNAFAYCLNRTNFFRSADQVPELMNMQGKPPTEKQFEILIRMHSDAGRGLRVYFVYEKMKKFGIKPRVFLYNRIMDALVKTDHLDLAMSVYEDFKEDGLVEESVTFMVLVKGLCRKGRIDEAFDLLGKMRENLCRPDVFAYTAMIRVLISENNMDGCLIVWEQMRKDGVVADAMAYTTLITALCNRNEVEKGYELFKDMRKKEYLIDRAVYGSLIDAFVAEGKIRQACDLLNDLMSSGYRADLTIYNSLIEGLCNGNRVDKAYKLFQFTLQEDLSPDFVTVNPILVVYAAQSKMNNFCRLLDQMQKLGLHVIDELSKFFLFMLGKGEREKLALEVFEYLKPKGYCSVSIYNIIIESLHKIGEVKKALELFTEMKDSDFEPDSSTYSNVIPCFVDTGDVKGACSCYNIMKEKSWLPTVSAYCSLVYGLCEIGEIDAALTLVRDCLGNVTSGPMEFKYTLTVLHVCRSGDPVKVIDVIDEMTQEGCPPNAIIYSAVISGMCDHGTLEDARKVFESMRERKILTEANLIMYDELLIDHMKKKTAGLVLSGLKFFGLESKLKSKGSTILPGSRKISADQVPELMNMQGKPPTEKQFEILIRMNSDAGRGLRVHFVYEKMKKFGIKPRVFLYNRIMAALVKTDHLDLAMSVYEDFKEDGLVEESVTFMVLVKGLCRKGRIDEAFDLLGKMRENLCKPDVFAYTVMIRVLISETNMDGCLIVWEQMRKDGVVADAMAYTTLITALCNRNEVEKGYELFREMRKKEYLIDRLDFFKSY